MSDLKDILAIEKEGRRLGREEGQAEIVRLQDRLAALEGALRAIAEGRGRFSLDHFQHARNTIEDMKTLAIDALAGSPAPRDEPTAEQVDIAVEAGLAVNEYLDQQPAPLSIELGEVRSNPGGSVEGKPIEATRDELQEAREIIRKLLYSHPHDIKLNVEPLAHIWLEAHPAPEEA